ncbi:hypothetical protein ACFWJ4_11800 [Kitasatospora sp. NPDC127067]|uniref:hypothetical protein n=1 Tax=Kitasatospora sp. NPDC127067 TaxID=3347126 RepID=UPI00364AABE8
MRVVPRTGQAGARHGRAGPPVRAPGLPGGGPTGRTPLDRCPRDVITAGRHVASVEKVLDGVGDLRLGGAPGSPHF